MIELPERDQIYVEGYVPADDFRGLVAENARLNMALEVIALDMNAEPSKSTRIRRTTARLALGLEVESAPRPEVVAAELAGLRAEIADSAQELRESIADLEASLSEPEPEPEPEPPPIAKQHERAPGLAPVATLAPAKQGIDGLGPRAREALQAIREHGELRPARLAELVGRKSGQVHDLVDALLSRGLILAEGTTQDRVYKALPRGPGQERVQGKPLIPPKRPEPSPSPAQQKVDVNRGGTIEGRALEAAQRGGTISEIAHRLGLGTEEVGTALRKLEREGEVRSRSHDGHLVWSAS